MAKYIYNNEDDFDDRFDIEVNWPYDENKEYIAVKCAEDFYSNHDGWEYDWPLKMYLWTSGGKKLGVFEVERETVPEFHANKLKD